MFARFGHMKFNAAEFDENRHDADSVRSKDFSSVGSSSKSITAISASAKSFSAVSPAGGKPFVEVGG